MKKRIVVGPPPIKYLKKYANGGQLSEFETAFAKARKEQGSTGVFDYKGKSYNTKYKEEVQGTTAPKYEGTSFSQAFAKARAELGANKVFSYNGREYTTNYASTNSSAFSSKPKDTSATTNKTSTNNSNSKQPEKKSQTNSVDSTSNKPVVVPGGIPKKTTSNNTTKKSSDTSKKKTEQKKTEQEDSITSLFNPFITNPLTSFIPGLVNLAKKFSSNNVIPAETGTTTLNTVKPSFRQTKKISTLEGRPNSERRFTSKPQIKIKNNDNSNNNSNNNNNIIPITPVDKNPLINITPIGKENELRKNIVDDNYWIKGVPTSTFNPAENRNYQEKWIKSLILKGGNENVKTAQRALNAIGADLKVDGNKSKNKTAKTFDKFVEEGRIPRVLPKLPKPLIPNIPSFNLANIDLNFEKYNPDNTFNKSNKYWPKGVPMSNNTEKKKPDILKSEMSNNTYRYGYHDTIKRVHKPGDIIVIKGGDDVWYNEDRIKVEDYPTFSEFLDSKRKQNLIVKPKSNKEAKLQLNMLQNEYLENMPESYRDYVYIPKKGEYYSNKDFKQREYFWNPKKNQKAGKLNEFFGLDLTEKQKQYNKKINLAWELGIFDL